MTHTQTQKTLAAAETAYTSSLSDGPGDQALAAFDLATWLVESGKLLRAEETAHAAWTYALESLRIVEGMPAREVVQLIDGAGYQLIEVLALTQGNTGVQRTLDDLIAVHERLSERLTMASRFSTLLHGHEDPVDATEILRGRPSALAKLLGGDPDAALRIVDLALRQWEPQARGSGYHLRMRLLAARCLLAVGDRHSSRRLLIEALEEDPVAEYPSLRCEAGDLLAQTYVGAGAEQDALRELDTLLDLASREGLALRWIDQMCTRAELLESSGDRPAAQTSARFALLGPRDEGHLADRWPQARSFPLPIEQRYRTALLRMQGLLSSISDDIRDRVQHELQATEPVPQRSRYRGRPMPPRAEGEARRQQLHEQALQVIREFDASGTPFVLYLRKFDITVLHQAALLGPALLEVGLYDQLPTSCNMLTIQNPDELVGYSGTGIAYDRTVPSLELADDEWQDVARHLIANAKWIVSECLMMTPGVRLELEIIDEYERHDRTVLVLPSGILSKIDDDPLIQRFHNYVWAWELSDVELRDIPLFAEILSTR